MTLKLALPLALALIALTALSPLPAHSRPAESLPLWGPYLTAATETEIVINWKTAADTWGVVQFAPAEQFAQPGHAPDFVIDPLPRQLHQVKLAGLQPGERYRYRVWMLSPEASPESFTALPPADAGRWLQSHAAATPEFGFTTLGAASFRFVVYGDTQEQTPWFTQLERHKLVAGYIAQEADLAFVVHLGDFTYDAADLPGWDPFFAAARDLLANTPLFPVLGNHENNSPVYYETFGQPAYYSFASGAARFFVLDTTAQADYAAQRAWLERELASAVGQNFVFYHHPAYSSDARNYGGWELSRSQWEDLFVAARVRAVFSGHVHAYERYQVRGLNYFVAGTGGGALTELAPEPPPGSQNRLARTLGYARVTVTGDSATVEYLQVARISDDNRQVLEVYPFNTVFETVRLDPAAQPTPGAQPTLPARPAGEFKVSPVSLSLAVPRGGRQRFTVYIVSSHDAQIHIATEGLPFVVQPALLPVAGSEQPQKIELELLGSRAVAAGEYEGKLTFLRDLGDNVALGVKVKTTVTQTAGGLGFLDAHLPPGALPLIVAVVLVLAANLGALVAFRKYQARIRIKPKKDN